LFDGVWAQKRKIITEIYGFGEDSWEAQAGARSEAFSYFREQAPWRMPIMLGRTATA
jgi:hypothetical protein